MDLEKILAKVKAEPKVLNELVQAVKDGKLQQALKKQGIDVKPEQVTELGKKLLATGGTALNDLKNNDNVKAALDKGGDVLKGLLNKK